MNSIYKEFNSTELAFDRIVTDAFALPFTLTDVEVQPNDLVTESVLNLKLEKLYFNMLYLYGLCNISDFNFPTTFTGWVGVTGSRTTPAANFKMQFFSTLSRISSAITFLSAGKTTLDDIDDSRMAVAFRNRDTNNVATANKSTLVILNYDINNNPYFVTNQTLIDPVSGSLYFQDIAGLAVDNNVTLYVSDRQLNNVYAYDLYDTVSDDYIKSGRLFLNTFVGGRGGRYDPLKFNGVGKIVFTGENLIVEDTGNQCFKIYDKNLVWINTAVSLSLFYAVTSFNSIAYSSYHKNIYGINNKQLFIVNFNNNYSSLTSTSHDLTSILDADESMLDIKFAYYDPRVFYIVTTKRIIKKWTTKITSNIGIYNNSKLYNLKWLTVLPVDDETDYFNLYSASVNLSSNKIVVFQDGLNLITLLSDDFNVYTKADIYLRSDEYSQSWIFAKAFKKLLYNMLLLVKKVGYRFFQSLDATNTPIFIKKGYNQFVLNYNMPDLNTFIDIGVNENFQGATLNRCIKNIHDLQENMLTYIINNESVLTNLSPRVVSN